MKKLATLFTRSLQEFKQVKTVTVCAMMGAVALVLGSLSVEIIPSVRIGFSGIPNEFVAWLFGPVVGPLFNGTMDILKYLAKPTNAYFPGLTMVTMLAGCIYGCFFYGRPMRLWRVLAAKFTVALICNVILNTFCLSILLGKGIQHIHSLLIMSALNKISCCTSAHTFLIFISALALLSSKAAKSSISITTVSAGRSTTASILAFSHDLLICLLYFLKLLFCLILVRIVNIRIRMVLPA